MSMVSMMSLIPIGMPSIGESGLPARQRFVERSAAVLRGVEVERDEGADLRLPGVELGDAALEEVREASLSRWRNSPSPEETAASGADRIGRVHGFACRCSALRPMSVAARIARYSLSCAAKAGVHEAIASHLILRIAPLCARNAIARSRLQSSIREHAATQSGDRVYRAVAGASTAGSRERVARMIAFSISTTKKKIRPPRNSHGQTPSGSASVSNTDCSGGA